MITKKYLLLSYFTVSSMVFNACTDISTKDSSLVFDDTGAPSRGLTIIAETKDSYICTLMSPYPRWDTVLFSTTVCDGKGEDVFLVNQASFVPESGIRRPIGNLVFSSLAVCSKNKVRKIVYLPSEIEFPLVKGPFSKLPRKTQDEIEFADDYLSIIRASERRSDCLDAQRY